MNKIIGLSIICLIPLQAMAEQRPTSAAALCLHVRQDQYGNQRLENSCPQEVEAVWCTASEKTCVTYGNMQTISPGGGYPVGKGQVWYNGCIGRNSVKKTEGMLIWCNETR